MVTCPQGHTNPDGTEFCTECGAKIPQPTPLAVTGTHQQGITLSIRQLIIGGVGLLVIVGGIIGGVLAVAGSSGSSKKAATVAPTQAAAVVSAAASSQPSVAAQATATVTPSPSPSPSPSPTPAPTPQQLAAPSFGMNSQAIQCRQTAADTAANVTDIQPGTILTFDQQFTVSGTRWYQAKDQQCWVRTQSGDPIQVFTDKAQATAALAKAAAPGTVLYQADWSTGLNGWPNFDGWKVLNGQLLNDGSGDAQFAAAPVDLSSISDYAIEADIQIVQQPGGYTFGLLARDGAYLGTVYDYDFFNDHDAILSNKDAELANRHRFDPGKDKHTYRLELKGNQIRFLIDGVVMNEATDNKYLDPGKKG